LVASVVCFMLLLLVFVREQSYETALKSALARTEAVLLNATMGMGGVDTSGLDMRGDHVDVGQALNTPSSNLEADIGEAGDVINELAKLRDELRAVQQQLMQTESEKNRNEAMVQQVQTENQYYLKNLTEARKSTKQKIEEYKGRLAEKKLESAAYLHKLKEVGITQSAGKLMREQGKQESKGLGKSADKREAPGQKPRSGMRTDGRRQLQKAQRRKPQEFSFDT